MMVEQVLGTDELLVVFPMLLNEKLDVVDESDVVEGVMFAPLFDLLCDGADIKCFGWVEGGFGATFGQNIWGAWEVMNGACDVSVDETMVGDCVLV